MVKLSEHLSKKRKVYYFIVVLFLLLVSNYFIDDLKDSFFKYVYEVLDMPKRGSVITIFCFTICGYYFYYEKHLKSENPKGVFNISNAFFDFVSTFCTFSAVLNASLNLLSRILKEFTGNGKLFIDGNLYDFYFIIAGAILPIAWVAVQMSAYIVSMFKIEEEETMPKSGAYTQTIQQEESHVSNSQNI
jgi:hypothetical protein